MSMIDTDNRFIYIGSETKPPCSQKVYWNVVKTVYPIKQEHLDLLKTTMKYVEGLEKSGNNRVIQEIKPSTTIKLIKNPTI